MASGKAGSRTLNIPLGLSFSAFLGFCWVGFILCLPMSQAPLMVTRWDGLMAPQVKVQREE